VNSAAQNGSRRVDGAAIVRRAGDIRVIGGRCGRHAAGNLVPRAHRGTR
jgi:hypothetical protein